MCDPGIRRANGAAVCRKMRKLSWKSSKNDIIAPMPEKRFDNFFAHFLPRTPKYLVSVPAFPPSAVVIILIVRARKSHSLCGKQLY